MACAVALVGSCIPETPPNDVGAPDPSKVVVFFQIDGLVRGRGGPNAVGQGARKVFVAARPSGTDTLADVNPDGSFSFALAAGGNDVLELAVAKDEAGTQRGASTFMRVPLKRLEGEDHVCCRRAGAVQGKCQLRSIAVCEDNVAAPDCVDDGDCASLSGQVISITDDAILVDPPDAAGQVVIRSRPGRLSPLSLLRVENRGQRAVGGENPNFRTAAITDEQGVVQLKIAARGDDELVFRLYEIDGFYRSREHSIFVPDSPLTGVDIVGVFPFEGLKDNAIGKVAIRFAPYGLDARGICPDSNEEPALCFSGGGNGQGFNGGLDYSAIRFARFEMEGGIRVEPLRAQPSDRIPNVKFTDGDVLAGPQLLVLILDHSDDAGDRDQAEVRFTAARNFVNSLRSRDQLAIYTVGGDDGFTLESGFSRERQQLLTKIDEIDGRPPSGEADIFGAIADAGTLLRAQNIRRGRILLVTAATPSGDPADLEPYNRALDVIAPEDELGLLPTYSTYVVALNPTGQQFADELENLAFFSGGELASVGDPAGFLTAVADVTGLLSGAFVLLYDVPIPDVGKSTDIYIEAQVTLPGADGSPQVVTGTFSGDIEVRDAQEN